MSIDSLSKTSINLSFSIDREKPFKAKNGRLWAISKENYLVCVNYSNLRKMKETIFPEITEISSFIVSDDSIFCAALTEHGIFIANSETRDFYLFTEDQTISAIGWLSSTDFTNPILLMAHQTRLISYCEVFSKNQIRILDFGSRSNPIIGIVATQLSNKESDETQYGLILIEKNTVTPSGINICSYVLNHNFTTAHDNLKVIQAYYAEGLPYFLESPYIALSSSILGYSVFCTKMRLDQNIPSSLLGKQEMISIEDKPLWIHIKYNCIFIQTTEGILIYDTEKHLNDKSILVTKLDIKEKLDLDLKYSCFIVLEDDNLLNAFHFSDKYNDNRGFFYWLYTIMKEKDLDLATSMLLKGKFDPLEIYHIANNCTERFYLMNGLLRKAQISNKRIVHDIATVALESYIRSEIAKADRDEEAFVEWARDCVSKNYLSIKTIERMLQAYGWTSVGGRCEGTSLSIFNSQMERGDLVAAANTLTTLSKKDFITCAVRLFKLKPQETVDAMFETGYLDCKELIPLLLSDEAIQHISQLLVSGNLHTRNSWQRNLAAIVITKVEDEQERFNYAKLYVTMIHFYDYDFNFALRFWLEKGLNDIAATSMITTGRLQDAIIAAPDKIFDVLKQMNDDEKRKQTARKLLKSLDTENAQKTAEKLLNDEIGPQIGIDTLLNYLPDDKPIRSLIPALDSFFTDLEIREDELVKRKTEALKGIRYAHEKQNKFQQESSEFKDFDISEDSPCDLCGKSINGEEFVFFYCNHYFHKTCLENHFRNRIGLTEQFDITSSCPLCGKYCSRIIDLPYDNFKYQHTEVQTSKRKGKADPWSVEVDDLNELATKNKSKFGTSLKNFLHID